MYVSPKEAAKHYRVTEQCLRQWSLIGKIKYTTTKGGHRRYWLDDGSTVPTAVTERIIYARVSSRKQQGDLERQIKFLQEHYPDHRVVSDIGSGINFNRRGLKSILEAVFRGTVEEVVVAERDRFSRFGFELFEWIFKEHGALLIPHNQDSQKSHTEELAEDLMSIVHVFSSRHYGKRKYSTVC